MAQSSSLVDGAKSLADKVESAIMSIPSPKSKGDKSAEKSSAERRKYAKADDDSTVRKANDSFRKGAEDDKAAAENKAAQSRKVISTPSKSGTAVKNNTSAKKSPTRKRIEGK